MKEMQFVVEINASRKIVWEILWQDETFRQWAGIIDPGTYLVGELKEGNEIQFVSGNGYGVTSLVEKLTPNEYLLLRHKADTQDQGKNLRKNEWTGGIEIYELSEKEGKTILTVSFDVPKEMEEYFRVNYPIALERVSEMSKKHQ